MARAAVTLPLVQPMLASPGPAPADTDQWAYEVKWDGMRIMSYLDGTGGLRLLSRNANQATARYPELAELTELLGGRSAVLDGEVIATDEQGRPHFGRLQERMTLRSPTAVKAAMLAYPVTLMLFDVVHLDGRDLTGMSYRGRREVLESLPLDGTRVVVPPAWPGSMAGEAVAWTQAQGLEGVIAKRLGSSYTPGARSKDWIKIKHVLTADVVIGGWVPAGTTVKALLLGVRDGDRLRYVGNVGTGFSQAERKALYGLLEQTSADTSPFTGPGPDRGEPVRWCRPQLAGEVEYLEYTSAGNLRHPVWKGLRGPLGE